MNDKLNHLNNIDIHGLNNPKMYQSPTWWVFGLEPENEWNDLVENGK